MSTKKITETLATEQDKDKDSKDIHIQASSNILLLYIPIANYYTELWYCVPLNLDPTTPTTSFASASHNIDGTNNSSISTSTIVIICVVMAILFLATTIFLVFLLLMFQRKKTKAKNNSNAVHTNTNTEAAESTIDNTPNDTSYDMISYNAMEGIQDDGYYAEARINDKTNNPNFSEKAAQVNIDSMTDDKDLQDVQQLYAVVDKKKKQTVTNGGSDPSQTHSIIKTDKKQYNGGEEFELTDVKELYAVVNKDAKKKKRKEEQGLSEMYAVVDKIRK